MPRGCSILGLFTEFLIRFWFPCSFLFRKTNINTVTQLYYNYFCRIIVLVISGAQALLPGVVRDLDEKYQTGGGLALFVNDSKGLFTPNGNNNANSK